MAKLGLINNNELKKKIIENKKKTRISLKEKIKNKQLTLPERLELVRKLSEMPRNSSRVRYRNRCGLTGRPRAYYRDFGISRIALRELGSQGYIPGLTKSSW